MSAKFKSGYEAARFVATLTKSWRDEKGGSISVDELLAMMSTADEEGEIDEDNELFYYVVSDDGALGVTCDGEKSVTWLATPTVPVDVGTVTAEGAEEARTTTRTARPHGGVGFSDAVNDQKFKDAVKKNKKSTLIFTLVVLLAPIALVSLITLITGELEFVYGLLIGACLSAVLFIIYFVASFKDKIQKPWEGVVEQSYEKKVRVIVRHVDDRKYNFRTQYYTVFRDGEGKRHRVVERSPEVYVYFKAGDKVRYHGRQGLLFPYEKFDKSRDEVLPCVFCARPAPVVDDECPYCHRPLLK